MREAGTPATIRRGTNINRLRRFLATRAGRVMVLVALAVLLEAAVFHSYFLGWSIPPWDFLGSYNTDAFAWWTSGGFFAPPEWVPTVWAGYPSAITLQNSAWYLPVGSFSLFGPYTLHAAAVLSALHVALGFFGTYRLLRAVRLSFIVSTLGATAAFFGVAYFSNAQHLDIVRGYALIPWLLLVLSPAWPWRAWWSVPLGALVLWQAATGMYPGMVFVTAYVGIVWVIAYQSIERAPLRRFLLPLAIAAVSAVLLCMPRLLPYFLMQEDAASGLGESSQFSVEMIGTLLYGYSSAELPNDISMRSFFIPATVLLLALFARWRDRATKLGVALAGPAVLLGMPFFPWFDLVQSLPGLGLSRFTMSDFKPFLILAVILLAGSGMTALLESRKLSFKQLPWWRLMTGGAFIVVMGLVAINGPFTRIEWFFEFVILVTVAFVILVRLWSGEATPRWTAAVSVALITLTALSGVVWAFTTAAPWNSVRVATEAATFGRPVSELLDERDGADAGEIQRPRRLELPKGFDVYDLYGVEWNRSYYTGELSVGGYLNLKGSTTQRQLEEALLDEESGEALAAFLAAPGHILTADELTPPLSDELTACSEGDCGPAAISPTDYSPGRLAYAVTADRELTGLLNEAYFEGWTAQACSTDVGCVPVEVGRHDFGLISVELPRGDYVLELEYRTPGRVAGWLLFTLGSATVMAAAAFQIASDVRRRKNRNHSE